MTVRESPGEEVEHTSDLWVITQFSFDHYYLLLWTDVPHEFMNLYCLGIYGIEKQGSNVTNSLFHHGKTLPSMFNRDFRFTYILF